MEKFWICLRATEESGVQADSYFKPAHPARWKGNNFQHN
jgi:hypothetical protein